jgi:hypothetical protein
MYNGAGIGRKGNQDLVCNQEAGHYAITFSNFSKYSMINPVIICLLRRVVMYSKILLNINLHLIVFKE